jgi:hypothetical protein
MFFILDQPTLFESLTMLIEGKTAPTGPAQ